MDEDGKPVGREAAAEGAEEGGVEVDKVDAVTHEDEVEAVAGGLGKVRVEGVEGVRELGAEANGTEAGEKKMASPRGTVPRTPPHPLSPPSKEEASSSPYRQAG